MFQIIFNELSAAEMAALPKTLQLDLLAEFQILRRAGQPRLESIRRDRTRRKKAASLSSERLSHLFRAQPGRRHCPSRPAQEHAAGFSFPQQTADGGGRSTRA